MFLIHSRVNHLLLCVLLTLNFCLFVAHGATDWPMWGYDAARSEMTPMQIPQAQDMNLHWVRQLGLPQRAWPAQGDDFDKLEFDLSYSPVVMGNKIFVGSMNNDRMTAYAVDTGKEIWRYYAGGPVRLAPAAWQGKIYFVSDDGHLYCLNADNGRLKWKFKAAPADYLVLGNKRIISMWPARGAPVIKDGKVYFASGVWPFMGTFIYALDARTGEVVWANTGEATNWQYQPHGGADAFAGLAPQGYLAASGDRLVVAGGRTPPALLDRNTGRIVHINLRAKGDHNNPAGGYSVRTDGQYYYNHGTRRNLSDGGGDSHPHYLRNEPLNTLVEELSGSIDGEVFTAIAARGRIFVVTVNGALYCFGPEERALLVYEDNPCESEKSQITQDSKAASILDKSQTKTGYGLFLGVGDGDLIEQLAVSSDLHIVGIDADPGKINKLRRRFDDAGLYGTKISLLHGDPADVQYPPYISSLVVIQDPKIVGDNPEMMEKVYSLLRPYDGNAFLALNEPLTGLQRLFGIFQMLGKDQINPYQKALKYFTPTGGHIQMEEDFLILARTEKLPDAGSWTHQYADSANTVMSKDARVRLPLGPLWFGGTSNDNVLPRHHAGPRPQVAGGRLVILGVETISARDVYTGRELWIREFPGVGHPFTNLELERQFEQGRAVYMSNDPGAAFIGSPYVTLPDSVYLRYGQGIYRLAPDTGETLAEFKLPENKNSEYPDWGHISVYEDVLITTTEPHIYQDGRLGERNWDASASDRLVVFNRFTGEKLWTREADIGFRHNAIVSGNGRLFVIDRLSEEALQLLQRRGREAPEDSVKVIALDVRTGDELWVMSADVFGTFLSYSEEYDILLEGGTSESRWQLPDEPRRKMIARKGSDGSVLWERSGVADGPRAIRGDEIIPARPGRFMSLLTGQDIHTNHPLTEKEIPLSYWKSYGCGTGNFSQNLILFRSAAAGFADIENDSGTGNLGGFKTGCTASMIAADGILNSPDYTRTCSCSYQNQTSLGLIHMPEIDIWTAYNIGENAGTLKQVGINLNAPGNRRAQDGTFWVHYPQRGAPTPEIDIEIEPENVMYFRKHSLLVDSPQGYNWVGASGVEGIESIKIKNLENAVYIVELHFAEPEQLKAGKRVFDILLQGNTVLENFDIVKSAGQPDRCVTKSFKVEVDGQLEISLKNKGTSKLPLLNGFRLRVDLVADSGGGNWDPAPAL